MEIQRKFYLRISGKKINGKHLRNGTPGFNRKDFMAGMQLQFNLVISSVPKMVKNTLVFGPYENKFSIVGQVFPETPSWQSLLLVKFKEAKTTFMHNVKNWPSTLDHLTKYV